MFWVLKCKMLVVLFFVAFLVPDIQGQGIVNPRLRAYKEIRSQNPALVVNGATITHGQIDFEVNRLKRRDAFSAKKTIDHLTPAAQRNFAIDNLIDEYLALQTAAEAGIQVTTAEVQQAFSGVMENAGPTVSIEETLVKQGLMNEDLMSQGLKNLYIDKVRRNFAANLPAPTDDELREFYSSNLHVFEATPERVFARQIVLLVPQGAGSFSDEDREVKERAQALLDRLRNGEDFKSLANQLTEDPEGIGTGGEIGWVVNGIGNRILNGALFSLQPGEYPERPVRLLHGYTVPTIDKREEAVIHPFEEVRDRVIQGWQISKFREWLREKRRDAKIDYYEDLPQKDILEGKRPQKVYN